MQISSVSAQIPDFEQWITRRPYDELAFEALISEKYDSAITYYTKWLEASPHDNDAWYNLACAYGKKGEKDLAMKAWITATKTGFKDAVNAEQDPDLAIIREDRTQFNVGLETIKTKEKELAPIDAERKFLPIKALGTYLVLLPPDYTTSKKTYQVCVILHGAGLTENPYGKFTEEFGRDNIIYIIPRSPYPNFPTAIIGKEPAYTANFPENVQSEKGLSDTLVMNHIRWIKSCLDDARKSYRISNGKILMIGHSQGAAYCSMYALTYPTEVASYLAFAGPTPRPSIATEKNMAALKANGVRVSLIHGEEDVVVPYAMSKDWNELLQKNGVNSNLKTISASHAFTKDVRELVTKWIDAEIAEARKGRVK